MIRNKTPTTPQQLLYTTAPTPPTTTPQHPQHPHPPQHPNSYCTPQHPHPYSSVNDDRAKNKSASPPPSPPPFMPHLFVFTSNTCWSDETCLTGLCRSYREGDVGGTHRCRKILRVRRCRLYFYVF
jgi:hypothetical protein